MFGLWRGSVEQGEYPAEVEGHLEQRVADRVGRDQDQLLRLGMFGISRQAFGALNRSAGVVEGIPLVTIPIRDPRLRGLVRGEDERQPGIFWQAADRLSIQADVHFEPGPGLGCGPGQLPGSELFHAGLVSAELVEGDHVAIGQPQAGVDGRA